MPALALLGMPCELPCCSTEISDSPAQFLDGIPSPVFILDEDVRILWGNAAALQMVRANEALGQKAGDALLCESAVRSAGGCGTSAHCGKCVLRVAVGEARRGAPNRDRIHRTVWMRYGKAVPVTLLVSASAVFWKGRDAVLVFLKDITELEALQRIVPICMCCRKVRDDSSYWKNVETYLEERMSMSFSHSVCPTCQAELLSEADVEQGVTRG